MKKKPFGWIIKSREDFEGCENDPWIPATRMYTLPIDANGDSIPTTINNAIMDKDGLFSKAELEDGTKGRVEVFRTRKEARVVAKELTIIYCHNFFFRVFPVYLE